MSYFYNMLANGNISTIYSFNHVIKIFKLSQYVYNNMMTRQAVWVYSELWLNIHVNRMVKNIMIKMKHIATILIDNIVHHFNILHYFIVLLCNRVLLKFLMDHFEFYTVSIWVVKICACLLVCYSKKQA